MDRWEISSGLEMALLLCPAGLPGLVVPVAQLPHLFPVLLPSQIRAADPQVLPQPRSRVAHLANRIRQCGFSP